MDASTSRILNSQVMGNKLLFQVDLAAGEAHRYFVLPASQLAAVPPVDVKTAARVVPERLDDFAWENDRIAHRVYGPAIKAIPNEVVSSGVDVWVKSVRYPVVDKWYKQNDYHFDHGEGVDNYDVGISRGCGGMSIVDGKTMYNSSVYKTWKILANGPLRSVFELTYDNWDAGGRKVAETARISIDAGSNLSRVESIFTSDKPDPLLIGVGIAQRKGDGHLMKDEAAGILSYWEPEMAPNGTIACAVMIPGKAAGFLDASHALASSYIDKPKPVKGGEPPTGNYFVLGKATVGQPITYYFGAGWSKSGDFPAAENWDAYVRDFAQRLKSPLVVIDEGPR
jgi:unsaturated rhamnogalacturonyl hydrolase